MTLDLCIYLEIRGNFCQVLVVVTFQLKSRRSCLIRPQHLSGVINEYTSQGNRIYIFFSFWLQKLFQIKFDFAHQFTSQTERQGLGLAGCIAFLPN
jgi:hypothetical protein